MKHLFRLRVRTLFVLAATLWLALASVASAAPPSAPRNLAGQVDQDGRNDWIILTFERGSGIDPESDWVVTIEGAALSKSTRVSIVR